MYLDINMKVFEFLVCLAFAIVPCLRCFYLTVDLPYCSNNNNGKPIRYNNICEQYPRTKIKFNFE